MRIWLAIAAANGFMAVALGAFGAHVLASKVDARQFDVFEKAVQYQMWHALALLGVGVLGDYMPGRMLTWSGMAFTAGLVLFSGSLYVIGFTGNRSFGVVAPFGGVAFLIGWVLLFAAVVMRD